MWSFYILNWKKKNSDTGEFRRNCKLQVRIELTTSDALTTQPLETLWRAGSEFLYNHTSHTRLYRGLARNRPFTNRTKTLTIPIHNKTGSDIQDLSKWSCIPNYTSYTSLIFLTPEAEFKALPWIFSLHSFLGYKGPYMWLNLRS